MNDKDASINTMVNKIISAIDNINRKLSFDKTFPSIVWGKQGNKYKISYENRLYSVSSALGGVELDIGTSVWVKIPNGKLREMHICGIRNK